MHIGKLMVHAFLTESEIVVANCKMLSDFIINMLIIGEVHQTTMETDCVSWWNTGDGDQEVGPRRRPPQSWKRVTGGPVPAPAPTPARHRPRKPQTHARKQSRDQNIPWNPTLIVHHRHRIAANDRDPGRSPFFSSIFFASSLLLRLLSCPPLISLKARDTSGYLLNICAVPRPLLKPQFYYKLS